MITLFFRVYEELQLVRDGHYGMVGSNAKTGHTSNRMFKQLLVIVSGGTSSLHIVQSRFFDESSVKNATTSNYFSVCNGLSSVQFEHRKVDHNSI